jgi:TRAP-type C4-dicarboxylate transport system substrate-binding protein
MQETNVQKVKWLQSSLVLVLVLLSGCSSALAGAKYTFKVATIAPEGSIWTKRFHDFVAEVAEKSNGEIGFKIYAGGIMGDDRAMYRKMQIGQLHGGGFTMTGIGSVVPDFRVMGIPFLFQSYDEVDKVTAGLREYFNNAFAKKGLEFIALTEVGFVYSMSTIPISTLPQLQRSKTWAPEGDPISTAYLDTLGITPIPLSIPDVLTSLQTGMVETVFNSLYGAIVLQWFTKAVYISDIPFGYAYGTFLLDRKKFYRLPENYRKLIKSTAKKHFDLLIQDTRTSNRESRQVLLDNGVSMVVPDPVDARKLIEKRDETVQRIGNKAFSKQSYELTLKLLEDFRSKTAKKSSQ